MSVYRSPPSSSSSSSSTSHCSAGGYPASYGREANFYVMDGWIGEVIAQSNTVTLQYKDYE